MFSGSIVRVAGLPISIVAGLANTALIIAHTGETLFGIVSTVATLSLLLPFTDLGVGAIVTTAVARASISRVDRRQALLTIRTAWSLLWIVTVVGIAIAAALTVAGLWAGAFAHDFTAREEIIVGFSVAVFFVSVPFSLGARVLIGLGRNALATALSMSVGLITLAVTGLLTLVSAQPLWYVVSGFGGTLIAGLITSLVAAPPLAKAGMLPFGSAARTEIGRAGVSMRSRLALLSGSGAMLIIMVGLPLGLQTGRLVISHTRGDAELSEFALAAQLYVMSWGIMVTAGNALWPMFARSRHDPAGSFRVWRRMVILFGGLAVIGGLLLTFAGPPLATVVSGGRIEVDIAQMAAFSLLIVAQSLHLPGGVLLTTPRELRWQALCTTGMAIISLAVGLTLAPVIGGPGVTIGAILGVLLAQFVPDVLMVRRFLYRRPEAIADRAD